MNMSTHSEGMNTHPATCRDCGQALAPGQGIVFSVWGYPWDGSDTEGSITEELDRYTVCQRTAPCWERVVASETNVQALRAIAADVERVPDTLRERARQALNSIAQIRRAQAHAADLAAREVGYGAIGNGVP